MKKSVVFSTVILTLIACNSHAETTLTQKALKPVIRYQCTQELSEAKLWKASTFFMQQQAKAALQTEVCDCVGEHALKDVPASAILKATVSEEAKNQLTRQAIANSLKFCISTLIK